MRISGGDARGIPLKVPKGDRTRPATDKMREALFSHLGPVVEGAQVADLFAGSGSYGLEALSRGAAGGTFVEKHPGTAALLRGNLKAVMRSCGRADQNNWRVLETDVFSVEPPGACNIYFIDPPYASAAELLPRLFAEVLNKAAHGPQTRACVEIPGDFEFDPEGWTLKRRLGPGRPDAPDVAIFTRASRRGLVLRR